MVLNKNKRSTKYAPRCIACLLTLQIYNWYQRKTTGLIRPWGWGWAGAGGRVRGPWAPTGPQAKVRWVRLFVTQYTYINSMHQNTLGEKILKLPCHMVIWKINKKVFWYTCSICRHLKPPSYLTLCKSLIFLEYMYNGPPTPLPQNWTKLLCSQP